MNQSSSIPPDMNRRLNNAKTLAQSSDEGSTFFIEVSYYPVVSLFIKTGKPTQDDSNKNELHLEYVYQPETYPKLNLKNYTPEAIGYTKYMALSNNEEEKMSFDNYKTEFNGICQEISQAIKQCHGIKTYEDGDESNETISNIVILHVCDIMNLFMCKENNTTANLFLKTTLFDTIPQRLSDQININFISEERKEFFITHIDFFYMCFGYFGNTSFIPIRTSINRESEIFIESKFFTNCEHYKKHQIGKLKEINQNEIKMITRLVYRSM